MSEIKIISASLNQIKELQNLNDEVFIDNSRYDEDLKIDWAQSDEGGKKYFTELLKSSNSICLIAKDNDKNIGYLVACPKEIPYRLSKYIEIENMGVIPEYRCRGIGQKLIDECLKIAKERGFQKVYVNAYFKNIGAINFYKKNGFTEIDLSLEKSIK